MAALQQTGRLDGHFETDPSDGRADHSEFNFQINPGLFAIWSAVARGHQRAPEDSRIEYGRSA